MISGIPEFITYAPSRIAGAWRMHETVGHLRNAIANNRGGVKRVMRLRSDGTWILLTVDEVMKDGFR